MIIFFVCLVFTLSYNFAQGIRVCPTFNDYYTIFLNDKCFDNPDYDGNPEAIVGRWGFNFKQYNMTTNDGYILAVFRIRGNQTKKNPVVMGHGITLNALCFMFDGRKSLAYQVANAGYDVWLINFRGTRFSRGHVNLTTNDSEYFDGVGLQEMAEEDLKTVVTFVYKTTKEKVTYIGYSMGTTIGFIYSSIAKKRASRIIKNIIYLAPIARFDHSTSLLVPLAYILPVLKIPLQIIFPNELLPYSDNTGKNCYPFPFEMKLCEAIASPLFGSVPDIDPVSYPVSTHLNSDSVSYKLITHYAQIVTSKRFQQFDFGASENVKHYGVQEPPLYNISEISVPTTFFVGKNDILATPEDATYAYNQLSDPTKCGFRLLEPKDFGHRDFILSVDIVNIFQKNLLKLLQQQEVGKCL